MLREVQSDIPQINRRSFCGRALITSAGVVLMTKTVDAATPSTDQNLAVYPPQKIDGAERLMPGCSLYFNYPKREDRAVLVRAKDGEFVAFSRKCAHLGCAVEFDSTRQCLACPCHRGTYDSRTGYVVYGPPPRPLDQIILQVRAGGEVWAVGKTIGNSNDHA
jgi:cytochrome b6-f complex iron-sulfur subunit